MRLVERKPSEINRRSQYLCKIDGEWMAGRFTKEWHGWLFSNADSHCSYQLDGEDGTQWGRIYLIQER